MRILVTGANGQVGHELLRALGSAAPTPPLPRARGREASAVCERVGGCSNDAANGRSPHEVLAATRDGQLENGATCERIDMADLDALPAALDRIAPDLIINAAAYTAVDRAEDEPELAMRVNADAVGVMGAWAARRGARIVHYSTDYVFDGTATAPYCEDDATGPVSVYGRTKLAGEIALRDSGARHLVFRAAWVYAARGHNFLRTMLRLGAERDELRVVDDQIGAPTPASLIAEVTAQVIVRWLDPDAAASLDGTYHLVAAGQTSWCGFARAIFERATRAGLLTRIGIHPPRSPFVPKGEEEHDGPSSLPPPPQEGGRAQRGGMRPRVVAISTADYPTKAVRPAYSVLDTSRLSAAFGITLPSWQAGLDQVIRELAAATG